MCRETSFFFCERLRKSDGAPSLVEPVPCPVLSRSSFGVDAQQLVAVDLDSRVRRISWISGVYVNEEQYPQVPVRKFLDEEERRNICRHNDCWVILAYMCVKLRVHFGSILGPFWVHFGSILGPFWVHHFVYCLSGDAS